MQSTESLIKATVAATATICTGIWGKADVWLIALLVFLVADYLTGIAAAYITQQLSSKIGFKGIVKKVVLLAVIAVANIMDITLGLNEVMRSVVCGFYIANEGLSILENASKCGVKIPSKLLGALKQLQSEDSEV